METSAGKMYTKGEYLDANPTWHAEDSPWKASNIAKMLERNQLSPKSVCEVGCGAGRILDELHAKLPSDVTLSGYDISPQASALNKHLEKPRLTFHLADLLSTDAPRFDLLLCIDVFEHVEDYFGFLRKLKTKAEWKIFHIPLELSANYVLRKDMFTTGRKAVGHIHYFSKETALATLEEAGYDVKDHFFTAGDVDLPARNWRKAVAKIPRRALYSVNPEFAVRLLGGYSLMVLAR